MSRTPPLIVVIQPPLCSGPVHFIIKPPSRPKENRTFSFLELPNLGCKLRRAGGRGRETVGKADKMRRKQRNQKRQAKKSRNLWISSHDRHQPSVGRLTEFAPSGRGCQSVHLIGSTARAFNYRKSRKRDNTGYWGLLGATSLLIKCPLPLLPITRLLVSKNRIGLKFIARCRIPLEKSNISFLGPVPFFVPGPSAIWSRTLVPPCLHFTPSSPHVSDLPPAAHPSERTHTHRPRCPSGLLRRSPQRPHPPHPSA